MKIGKNETNAPGAKKAFSTSTEMTIAGLKASDLTGAAGEALKCAISNGVYDVMASDAATMPVVKAGLIGCDAATKTVTCLTGTNKGIFGLLAKDGKKFCIKLTTAAARLRRLEEAERRRLTGLKVKSTSEIADVPTTVATKAEKDVKAITGATKTTFLATIASKVVDRIKTAPGIDATIKAAAVAGNLTVTASMPSIGGGGGGGSTSGAAMISSLLALVSASVYAIM